MPKYDNRSLTTAVSHVIYSSLGLLCLSFIYGIYGYLLTICKFIRLGARRFFQKLDRPKPPSIAMDSMYGEHRMLKLKSSGVSIHYVSKGAPNQPMILFIHGFPQCWYSWRNQMKYFSKEYRVVAIDQRGYGLSSKLPYVHDYRLEALASDVADVIEQLGYESCIIVGHDFGGFVAWTTAILYPHLVDKLVIMNCPHPAAFRRDFSLEQLNQSWFMFFDQSPLIPELSFEADDFCAFKELFHAKNGGFANKTNITDDDIEVYKYTFSQTGTTKAAINYFRALLRFQTDFSLSQTSAPVLLLWGCQNVIFHENLANASQKYCSDIELRKIPNASHWIHEDVPETVNKYMDLFLKKEPDMQYTYDI